MAKYVFGIDVGGTTVKCGLFSQNGRLEEKWEIHTRIGNEGEKILPDIADTIQKKMEKFDLKKEDVAGLGVGIPGDVKANGEVMAAVNIHWGRKDVAGELQKLTGIPVKTAKDANLAALGESWKGAGKGAEHLVMITLGTGLGGGIIIDGKMLAGGHGAGGEIGHAYTDSRINQACNCGNIGCLEQFVSATGLVNLAREELAAGEESTGLDREDLSAKIIFDAYKEKDAAAVRIVKKFSMYLGNALAFISCILDPEIIIFGGGVSKAGEALLKEISEIYREHAYKVCKDTPFVLAKLGNDAGIYGGAKLILDSMGIGEK